MRQRRMIASVAALATMGGTALMALANPSVANPSSGLTLTPKTQQNYSLVAGSDGATHALVPNTVLPRPAGVPANASPATLAKAYLKAHAQSFNVSNPAADLSVARTARLGHTGSAVKFQQKLDGVPVLGGQLIVSMDAAGNLQSITGETASGSISAQGHASDSLKSLGNLATINKVRAWVSHAAGRTVSGLHVRPAGQWVVNPQLVGLPSGGDVNLVTTRYLATTADQSTSFSVYVNTDLGVVYGYSNSPRESSNHRLICDAHNDILSTDQALCRTHNGNVTVVRAEDGKPASQADANTVYDNLGLTQLSYARYVNVDATKLIGLSDRQVGSGTNGTKKLRATIRMCQTSADCPMQNAFWSAYVNNAGKTIGGAMYYGEGVTGKDVTGHELSHGVTQQTSGLFYAYQSGAINESMSDVFGELIDLSNKIKGSTYDQAKYNWLIGEGSSLGVIRSMRNPTTAPSGVGDVSNFTRQPDKMTSKLWYSTKPSSPYWDEGGVHFNSGVGNKAAYLIAHGGTFGGQTVRGLGYAKTFKIYWSVENLLSSGADYKDLAVTLPIACTKAKADPKSYLTNSDCAQVKKATLATKMYSNAQNNAPVAVPYCPTGKKVRASLSQGFDSKVAGWSGLYLTRKDYGIDNVNRGADAALVVGQSGYNKLSMITAHKIPAGSWLRLDYDLLSDNTARLQYKIGTGSWKAMPTVKTTVNPGPWAGSPGWSSAKFSLVPLKGKNVRFRLVVGGGNGTYFNANVLWVDNFKVYTCHS